MRYGRCFCFFCLQGLNFLLFLLLLLPLLLHKLELDFLCKMAEINGDKILDNRLDLSVVIIQEEPSLSQSKFMSECIDQRCLIFSYFSPCLQNKWKVLAMIKFFDRYLYLGPMRCITFSSCLEGSWKQKKIQFVIKNTEKKEILSQRKKGNHLSSSLTIISQLVCGCLENFPSQEDQNFSRLCGQFFLYRG